jgi:hypothetical protein
MALGDRVAHTGLIGGSIAGERSKWSCDVVEQELNLGLEQDLLPNIR